MARSVTVGGASRFEAPPTFGVATKVVAAEWVGHFWEFGPAGRAFRSPRSWRFRDISPATPNQALKRRPVAALRT